ncbi:MAG: glycosyltransferase family 87 protein [Bryobacteraceae bacterium]
MGLAFNAWVAVCNWPLLGLDFNQFYAASHLAGTGHLYDWDALRKIEVEHGYEVPTARLPVVAYGYKILGGLPYAVARSIWLAGSIAALMVFALVWPGTRRLFMLAALAWSVPTTLVLVFGQDVPFWLLFFTVGLLLLERKRPWLAGFAFSLCICKFHLALGIPVMLAAQKRWKTLIAGAIAVLVWIASSFLIEGPQWPLQYARNLQMPALSPAAERMPNVHGLASYLPWTQTVELAGAVAILLLLWAACRGNVDLGTAGAAAAACGLLVGNHAYAGDCTLLIPISVLTLQRQGMPSWLEAWAVLVLASVPVVLLVARISLPGQVLIVGFVVAATIAGMAKPFSRALPAA